jgi:uncharacterized SAM-binding protein YcdF (DUF218 family)
MRQFASQLLSFFLSPAIWIVLLIILSYVFKNSGARKKCRWVALGIFLLFSNQWLLNSYARWWQPKPRNVTADSAYSCGILLGGFGGPDARDTSGYFNASADRFIQAVKMYKLGKIRHILISGGNGKREVKEFNEGEWASGEMEALGIPREAILFEDQSQNTAGNAEHTKELLDSANLKPPYLLITSAFHMPRASLLYKYAGVNTVAFPCNYTAGKGNFRFGDLVPDPNVLHDWNPFLKETVSYLLYRIKGK